MNFQEANPQPLTRQTWNLSTRLRDRCWFNNKL